MQGFVQCFCATMIYMSQPPTQLATDHVKKSAAATNVMKRWPLTHNQINQN